ARSSGLIPRGDDTDTQAAGLVPANGHTSQQRPFPAGSPHSLRDMNASAADETDSESCSGSTTMGRTNKVRQTPQPPNDHAEGNESAALLTLQRTIVRCLRCRGN
ncbi:hypothetical protein D0862_05342, partial [Hortaea werneckii]